jgi:hypothetical protein
MRTRALAVAGAVCISTAAIRAQTPPPWTLRGPAFEVGLSGVDLHRVRGAATLSGGGVAIADAGNTRVLIVGPSGTVLRTFGRRGGGPGDFQMIGYLTAIGDTIVVWDTGLSRMALWRPDGTPVGAVPLVAEAGRVVDVQAVVSPSQYVVTTRGGPLPPRSGLFHDTLPVFVLGSTGGMRPIGQREWSLSYVSVDGGGITRYSTPFLGSTLVAATRERIFVLPLGSAVVEVLGADGMPRSTVQLPVTARPHDRARVVAFRDSLLRLIEPGQLQMRERIGRVFGDAFPVPRYAAVAQRAVVVGNDVWFQGFPNARDSTVVWYVVAAEPARLVSQVVLPRDWVVLGGNANTALVLQRDDLGVERVSVYAIERGAR